MPNNLPDYRDINPFGDVRLCVKSSDSDSSCDFRVSSHQLVAISHFFRQLLGPESQFNEAVDFRAHREPTTPYHLPLDLEDHPLEVCESILRILHGKPPVKDINFNTGEGEPSDLLQIIKLSNYFGCGEALGVWVKLVIPISLNKRDGEYDEKIEELTKWLSVAFAFRLENAFRIVTRFCIQHGRRKAMEAKFEVGGVAVVKGEYLEFYRLGNTPRKVVNTITARCVTMGKTMANMLLAAQTKYEVQKRQRHLCRRNDEGCDILVACLLKDINERFQMNSWMEEEPVWTTTLHNFMFRKLIGPKRKKFVIWGSIRDSM